MSAHAILAFTVAAAVLSTIVAHLLDQMGVATPFSRIGVRLTALGYVAFVVASLFAEAL